MMREPIQMISHASIEDLSAQPTRYHILRIGLALAAFLYCATALGADEELLGIVAQKLASHTNQSIAPYLDRTSAPDPSLPNMQKLKKTSAFGMIFSGRAEISDGQFIRISYGTDDWKVAESPR
jgi:hypothetical protein